MSMKKIVAIVVFVLVGLVTFTFAGDGELEPISVGDANTPNTNTNDPIINNQEDIENEEDEEDNNILQQLPNLGGQGNNNIQEVPDNEQQDQDDEEPTVDPVITINNNLNVIYGDTYDLLSNVTLTLDPSDTTTELNDIVITGFNASLLGPQTVTYSIEDIHGKTAEVTRIVTLVDKEAPSIKFDNGTVKKLVIGSEFEMIKTEVTDNHDKNPELIVDSSNVKMNEYGTYTAYVSAKDASGNVSAVTEVTYKIVNDTDAGYTDVVSIEGVLTNSSTFDIGDTKTVLDNNLVVTATRNNGTTFELEENEYKVSSFNTKIANANKHKDNKTFVVKYADDTDIKDKVKYTVVRSYNVKFVLPTVVEGIALPAEYSGKVISEETLRYGSSINEPTLSQEYKAITMNVQNYIEFTGWDKEIDTVTGEMTFTATYRVLVRNYHAKVYTNLDGFETMIANCAMKYGNNIASKCAILNSEPANYEGFKFTGYTVNDLAVSDITSLNISGETKIVANYERINNSTNLVLTTSENYNKEFVIFRDINITASEGNKLLVIGVDKAKHTNIDEITLHFTNGDSKTVALNDYYHLVNPIFYAEYNENLVIDRVEFKYINGFLDELGNIFYDASTQAKFTYDQEEDKFYSYGE